MLRYSIITCDMLTCRAAGKLRYRYMYVGVIGDEKIWREGGEVGR